MNTNKTYKRVLVTGGAGCIGVQVCKELLNRGIAVHLFDLPEQISRAKEYLPEGIEIYYGSILDNSSLRDAMVDCDSVIHLAAYLGVRRTETNRLRCIEINIDGTKNVLQCAIQNRIKKIIFASSSEVYGEPIENPVTENSITQGKTVYAISKLSGEELCKAFAQRYPDLKYTILRYFNTYGPFQTAQFVIPKFLRNVIEGRPPVVYGNGKQQRSYCFAGDTAVATVDSLIKTQADNEIFNIGNSDNPISLGNLAKKVIKICGKEGEIIPTYQSEFKNTDREEDREIHKRFCDTSKAKRILKFVPQMDLDFGINKVIKAGILYPKWETTVLDFTLDDWLYF